jgi:hypothetical protein
VGTLVPPLVPRETHGAQHKESVDLVANDAVRLFELRSCLVNGLDSLHGRAALGAGEGQLSLRGAGKPGEKAVATEEVLALGGHNHVQEWVVAHRAEEVLVYTSQVEVLEMNLGRQLLCVVPCGERNNN